MKKLSIITICYNEPNLEETCKSIINQTLQDFEWIVIDGASNKETIDIFEKYKYRIDKFVSEPDNGIYNACNKGIRLSEGEFIHFLNAGDSYYSNEVLETVFKENIFDKADVIYGEQEEINIEKPDKNIISKQADVVDNNLLINGCIHTSATFIRHSLFEKYGLFNEKYKIASDYESFVIFYQNSAIFKHLDIIISRFDKSGISSDKKYLLLHLKERDEIIRKYFTPKQIEKARKKCSKLTFLEQIFSITNSCGGLYKIITVLGIHFKIRRHFNA